MSSVYKLIVENTDVSAITGQHTVDIHIEEHFDDGGVAYGVKEKYGISLAEINLRFSGSVDRWLLHVGRQEVAKHKARNGVHSELMSKRNTSIEIPEL